MLPQIHKQNTPANTSEQQFRESLKDVLVTIEKLSDYCVTPQEMYEMVNLAITSDGQLRILAEKVLGKS
jgi:hypothetical protein